MGKKEKNKKKGKGAEKTAEKTQKKLKTKLKKTTGEDDIESIVKAIEDEEKKRKEVKEVSVNPPSHRSNLSVCSHPDNPELVFFGGEFYNGSKTTMFSDLLIYNIKRKDWVQVKSPAGPPPRSSHQALMTANAGGQLWIFGGEFASASETQFHHYRDLWVFHFGSKRWEKVVPASGTPPTSRSGHRMALLKRHLIVFGGFHDNLMDCKYFNDISVFSIDERAWRKVTVVGNAPGPRSGCCMQPLQDGRILVYGGFCKEKKNAGGRKKDAEEEGRMLTDMHILAPDKHDETMSKWRWLPVKQIGNKPCARSGMSSVIMPGTNKILCFGGVQDDPEDSDSDDDDGPSGTFFNDLYSVHIENERATWHKIELTGKKDAAEAKLKRRRKKEDQAEEDEGNGNGNSDETGLDATKDAVQGMQLVEPEETTKIVEEGAFTITSTISNKADEEPHETGGEGNADKSRSRSEVSRNGPSPRFGSALAVRQGILYLFGGMVEDSEDRQFTHKDLYSLDAHKLDEWDVLIESDLKEMEWVDSGSDSDDDDEEEEGEDSDMDTD